MRAVLLVFILFALIVTGCNSPTDSSSQSPIITSFTATPDTIKVGRLSTVVVNASDPDGDPLTYSWEAKLGDFEPSANKNEIFYTALPCCGGRTNYVILTLKDDKGGESRDSVQIVVLD